MAILLDNKEITDFVNTTESVNVLSYKKIEEVHDNIFMITTHDNQTFLKEKKGDWRSKPVVEFSIHTGKALHKNVKFVLENTGKSQINYSKFGIGSQRSDKKVLKETTTKQELVTNKPAPVSVPPVVSEDQLKKHIESVMLQLLTSEKSEKFTKFFDVYTESFKSDMIKYTQKIAQRETYRAMESGGGTNAAQFADGGTMRGDLHVTGLITGTMGLSSLSQDGATNNQVLTWSDSLQQWHPADATANKKVFLVGDNIASNFIINHQFDSFDIIVQVYEEATKEAVIVKLQNIDPNNTQITFPFVPDTNSYRVIILS